MERRLRTRNRTTDNTQKENVPTKKTRIAKDKPNTKPNQNKSLAVTRNSAKRMPSVQSLLPIDDSCKSSSDVKNTGNKMRRCKVILKKMKHQAVPTDNATSSVYSSHCNKISEESHKFLSFKRNSNDAIKITGSSPSKPQKIFFEGSLNKSKTLKEPRSNESDEDIYEFFSNSQSDPDRDVNIDVVKRLVQQGKAVVSRPKNNRKKVVRKRNVEKKIAKKVDSKSVWKNILTNVKTNVQNEKDFKNLSNIEIFNNVKVVQPDSVLKGSKQKVRVINQIIMKPKKPPESNISTSNIAVARPSPKVDINKSNLKLQNATAVAEKPKTGINAPGNHSYVRNKIVDRIQLLDYVRGVVHQSTPTQTAKTETSFQGNNLSPISRPWRAENVPRTFHFSRSRDDLPSFSSDYIPASQTDSHRRSEVNSFNDSNAENISPYNENKQFNNSRVPVVRNRNGNRSPLKPLQVLSVSLLAKNKHASLSLSKSFHQRFMVSNHSLENIKEDTSRIGSDTIVDVDETHKNAEGANQITKIDFFGFDESDDEIPNANASIPIPTKESIQKRREQLRKRVSTRTPKPKLGQNNLRSDTLRQPKKQANIQAMFYSSTPVGNTKHTGATLKNSKEIHHDQADMSLFHNTDLQIIEEPNCSFDTTVDRRTYTRPTRKKKVRNFILLTSDDEEEPQESPKKRRKRRKSKSNDQLESFAKEFNSMCEEVDQYELVLEPTKMVEA